MDKKLYVIVQEWKKSGLRHVVLHRNPLFYSNLKYAYHGSSIGLLASRLRCHS